MKFARNPYRRNAFDAFPLDKAETSIKNIRLVLNRTRADWKDNKGRLLARDGSEWQLTEAQLNGMEEIILDPLRRLQLEQFVHQEHVMVHDPALVETADRLAAELSNAVMSSRIVDDIGGDLVGVLGRSLSPAAPAPLVDDLAWPEPPAPFDLELESLAQTILRER